MDMYLPLPDKSPQEIEYKKQADFIPRQFPRVLPSFIRRHEMTPPLLILDPADPCFHAPWLVHVPFANVLEYMGNVVLGIDLYQEGSVKCPCHIYWAHRRWSRQTPVASEGREDDGQ
jgi:hypothetical protein